MQEILEAEVTEFLERDHYQGRKEGLPKAIEMVTSHRELKQLKER